MIRPGQWGVVVSDLVAERAQGPGHSAGELVAALEQKPRRAGETQVVPGLAQKAELSMSEE